MFVGRTTPSDAEAIVGGADVTRVTGAHVRALVARASRVGRRDAPALAGADVWRETGQGKGRVRLQVEQEKPPSRSSSPPPTASPPTSAALTVTVERRTWFFQALLVTLVGLLAAVTGVAGLWQATPRDDARAATTRTCPHPPRRRPHEAPEHARASSSPAPSPWPSRAAVPAPPWSACTTHALPR